MFIRVVFETICPDVGAPAMNALNHLGIATFYPWPEESDVFTANTSPCRAVMVEPSL